MFKKILKYVGFVLAAFVASAAAFALYVEIDGIPRYAPPQIPEITVVSTPERLERGHALVSQLCVGCHEDSTTHTLIGRHMDDLPPMLGVIRSKNITSHPDKGIGRWTDGELVYLLRTGLKKDGTYLPPWMAKLPHMSDEDMFSIVAFLRSDDPMFAPTDYDGGSTQPGFVSKLLAHTVFGPLPYPTAPVPPPEDEPIALGRYTAINLECFTCHAADVKNVDIANPEKTPGFFGGGAEFRDGNKQPIFSANLTADDETGIGTWSEDQFVRAVKQGVRPDGRVLHAPMLPRTELSDKEARAVYAYLRTIPKIRNDVQRPLPAIAAPNATPGKKLYDRYGCVACHGDTGKGGGGDLLAANERFPNDDALRAWIEDAPAQKPDTKMPAWKGIIADDDYAPLIQHVRTLARPGKQTLR